MPYSLAKCLNLLLMHSNVAAEPFSTGMARVVDVNVN